MARILSDLSVLDAWHRLAFHLVRFIFIAWHSLAFHLRNETWRSIVVDAVGFIWHSLMMLSSSLFVDIFIGHASIHIGIAVLFIKAIWCANLRKGGGTIRQWHLGANFGTKNAQQLP